MSSTKSTKRKMPSRATLEQTVMRILSSPPSNKKRNKHSTDPKKEEDSKKQARYVSPDGAYISFALVFPLSPHGGAVNAQEPSPLAVSVSNDGQTVYACDISNTSIHAYSSEGLYLRQFGGAGKGIGKFGKNSNLSMSLSHHDTQLVYVCDLGHDSIQVFDAESGHFLHQYTHMTGPGVPRDDEFEGRVAAMRCVISHDGKFLFICRLRERRILCAVLIKSTAPQLHIVKILGQRKKTSTGYRLSDPDGFRVSGDGVYLYVCDRTMSCVTRIHTLTDELVPVAGSKRKVATEFKSGDLLYQPDDVCLSASGRYMYVSDTHMVHVFLTEDFSYVGNLVELAQDNGNGKDDDSLRYPAGMCFCAVTNRLYVCDSGNKRVRVYNALN